jgi:hypothetical protein
MSPIFLISRYVPENEKTCSLFPGEFPLILSGHDHHRIDTMINGTRLIKPGMDGVFASVIEIVWDDVSSPKPKIRNTFVETAQRFLPCPDLKVKTDAAYDVLAPLRNTMLAQILPTFRPLSSKNARGSTTTMGQLICSMLKQSLLQTQDQPVDAVILMGGNIRGNEDYADDAFFSLETLEAEIKSDEVIGLVDMPGSVLAAGIEATHAGDPIPGWFQYDDGITQQEVRGKVLTVAGKPIEPNRIYRVATKIKDLTNGQSPPLTVYYKAHPELLPAKGSYVNIHSELMAFFARNLFYKLWEATGELIPDPEEVVAAVSSEKLDNDAAVTPPVNLDRIEGTLRLSVLDRDGDGYVSVDDIMMGLRDFLGLSVDESNKTLAEQVHSYADVTASGCVTVHDFEVFCKSGIPSECKLPDRKWEHAFPEIAPEIIQQVTKHRRVQTAPSNLSALATTAAAMDHFFPAGGPFLKRRNTEQTTLMDGAPTSPPPSHAALSSSEDDSSSAEEEGGVDVAIVLDEAPLRTIPSTGPLPELSVPPAVQLR